MRKFLLLFIALLSGVISAQAETYEGVSYRVTKLPAAESPGEVEVQQSLSNGDGQSWL
jgi:hypothetical protein